MHTSSANLAHRRDREEALVAALDRSGPATPEALAEEVYADVDPRLHALASRSLLSGLIKLSEEGRAVYEDGHWRKS